MLADEVVTRRPLTTYYLLQLQTTLRVVLNLLLNCRVVYAQGYRHVRLLRVSRLRLPPCTHATQLPSLIPFSMHSRLMPTGKTHGGREAARLLREQRGSHMIAT